MKKPYITRLSVFRRDIKVLSKGQNRFVQKTDFHVPNITKSTQFLAIITKIKCCLLLKMAEEKGFILACGLGQGWLWVPPALIHFQPVRIPSFPWRQKAEHLTASCFCYGGGKGIRTLVGLLPNGFQEVAHPSRLIPDNLQNAPKFTSFSHFIGHLPENCEKNAR